MKNVSEVLTHLLDSPCYKKLRDMQTISRFIQAFPWSLRNGILFFYIKDEILFLVLKHPCFKQEFYHKIPLVKQLLRQYKEQLQATFADNKETQNDGSLKTLYSIKEIKYFVSNNAYQKELARLQEEEIPLYYNELSHGEFENLAKDKIVYAQFEKIRSIILQNQN